MRPSAAVIALVACAALITACGSGGPLSTQQLEAVSDSHLFYPGSHVVRVNAVAQEESEINAAPVDGFVSTVLSSGADSPTILAWYQRELRAHGWTYRAREPHGDVYDGRPVPPAYLFTRGTTEVFALAFDTAISQYFITYTVLIDHCDTESPYPLGPGACDSGRPV